MKHEPLDYFTRSKPLAPDPAPVVAKPFRVVFANRKQPMDRLFLLIVGLFAFGLGFCTSHYSNREKNASAVQIAQSIHDDIERMMHPLPEPTPGPLAGAGR